MSCVAGVIMSTGWRGASPARIRRCGSVTCDRSIVVSLMEVESEAESEAELSPKNDGDGGLSGGGTSGSPCVSFTSITACPLEGSLIGLRNPSHRSSSGAGSGSSSTDVKLAPGASAGASLPGCAASSVCSLDEGVRGKRCCEEVWVLL